MPTLLVENGFMCALSGLGKIRPLATLSEKRITRATREALRGRYGYDRVEVSCSARLRGLEWRGRCEIDGVLYTYQIYK